MAGIRKVVLGAPVGLSLLQLVSDTDAGGAHHGQAERQRHLEAARLVCIPRDARRMQFAVVDGKLGSGESQSIEYCDQRSAKHPHERETSEHVRTIIHCPTCATPLLPLVFLKKCLLRRVRRKRAHKIRILIQSRRKSLRPEATLHCLVLSDLHGP